MYTMYSYMNTFANNIHISYITYYHIYIIHIYYILVKLKTGIKDNLYIYKKVKLKATQLAIPIKQIVL